MSVDVYKFGLIALVGVAAVYLGLGVSKDKIVGKSQS